MKIKFINDNDVETGGGNRKHPGNKAYQRLISNCKMQFIMAQNDEAKRDKIAENVFRHITMVCNPPGRFVEKSEDGWYIIKSKDFALQKIKKGLNCNSRTVRAHLELRGMLPSKNSISRNVRGFKRGRIQRTKFERKNSGPVSTLKPLMRKLPKSVPITSNDWLKLCFEISKIDESEMKQLKTT